MYAILTFAVPNGWKNRLVETLPNGENREVKFKTKKEAEKKVLELVVGLQGVMSDYRIEKIP